VSVFTLRPLCSHTAVGLCIGFTLVPAFSVCSNMYYWDGKTALSFFGAGECDDAKMEGGGFVVIYP
jgi:hypothetical protein